MVLRTSEVMSKFRVQLSNRTAYSGRATVANLTQAGTLTVCEASLDESWVMPEPATLNINSMDLSDQFDGFVGYFLNGKNVVGVSLNASTVGVARLIEKLNDLSVTHQRIFVAMLR